MEPGGQITFKRVQSGMLVNVDIDHAEPDRCYGICIPEDETYCNGVQSDSYGNIKCTFIHPQLTVQDLRCSLVMNNGDNREKFHDNPTYSGCLTDFLYPDARFIPAALSSGNILLERE
jgi:hypothetical protein